MKIPASHAGKALTQLVKGPKLVIAALLDTPRMGQKELKSVYCVHEAFLLQSVHQPVSPVLRVASLPTPLANVSPVHQELSML